MTVTAHFIANEWAMHSFVLQTRAIHETHTSAHIAEVMQKATEEWKLTEKDLTVVTDNALDMAVAFELFEK